MATLVDPNDHDRFILRQRIRPVVNQYEFFLPNGDGPQGDPICFVQQKRFKFKEDIRFYTDDSKQSELMRIKARQRFDPRARYDVTDSAGNEVAKATEKSLGVALFRRLVGFVPYVGDFADWLPIPYHFVFMRGDCVLATNTRQAWKIGDTYTIDLSGDTDRTLDRRLVLATAVGMDALQAR